MTSAWKPLTDELLAQIRGKLQNPRVVAVGEIGLDYYWDTPDRPIQKHWFEEQLEMARQADLPVVIHSREAAQETMQIMQAHRSAEWCTAIPTVWNLPGNS